MPSRADIKELNELRAEKSAHGAGDTSNGVSAVAVPVCKSRGDCSPRDLFSALAKLPAWQRRRKPRKLLNAQARIRALPKKEFAKLVHWLQVENLPYREVSKRCLAQFGLRVGSNQLSKFYGTYFLGRALAKNAPPAPTPLLTLEIAMEGPHKLTLSIHAASGVKIKGARA